MNSLHVIVFGVIVCCALVSARQHGDRPADEMEQDEYSASNDEAKHRSQGKERHRRKRWQSGYGYQYPVPPNSMYYEHDRRDFDTRQLDILPQIFRALDELSAYVRRPQPPIYVPYPIHVPTFQYPCNCPNARPRPQPQPQPSLPDVGNVTFPKRWPEMSDENQNWGFVEKDTGKSTGSEDYDEDISRPISFKPVTPSRPSSRKQPDVEHGSTQAGEVELTSSQEARLGGNCYIAIIRCCVPYDNVRKQQQCFSDLGCQGTFKNGAACEYHNVGNALAYHEKLLKARRN